MLTRRTFLRSAAAGTAVLAAGGAAALALREAGGPSGAAVPLVFPSPAAGIDHPTATLTSARLGREVRWVAVVPPGVDRTKVPVVVALHAKGGDARAVVEWLGVGEALGRHVEGGGKPFVVVATDGGPDGFWHPRTDGRDPLGMVTDELLPLLARHGLPTERIGLMGWSMGGFGALTMARESVAGRLGGTEVVTAVATAPALWTRYDAADEDAFDDAAQFDRWGDLIAEPGIDGRVALRVDCGADDSFVGAVSAYRRAVSPEPEGEFVRGGGHDVETWRALLPAQLEFLASHLG